MQTRILLIVVSSAPGIWQVVNTIWMNERMNKCMKYFLYFPTQSRNKTPLVDDFIDTGVFFLHIEGLW